MSEHSEDATRSLRVSKSHTLTFLEQKDMLKVYYSDGTEENNEYIILNIVQLRRKKNYSGRKTCLENTAQALVDTMFSMCGTYLALHSGQGH